MKFICKYCSRETYSHNSNIQHEIRCSENPKKIEVFKNKVVWDDALREKQSKIMKVKSRNNPDYWTEENKELARKRGIERNKLFWTKENKELHSKIMSKTVLENSESYSTSNVSGRVKNYETFNTKGETLTVKGTWELLVAEYLTANKIEWTNKLKGIKYYWGGEKYYFPDFYLFEYDVFIEVKGYQRDQDIAKWKEVKNLIILKEKEIKLLQKGMFDIQQYIAGRVLVSPQVS